MVLDRRSLTLRLTLLFGLTSTIVLVLIGCVFYFSLGAHFLHEDALELQGKVELLRNLAIRVQAEEDVPVLVTRLQDALVGHHNLSLQLTKVNGEVLYEDPQPPGGRIEAGVLRRVHRMEGLEIEALESAGHDYRLTRFALRTSLPGNPELRGALFMNVDHHEAFMQRVRETTLLSVLLGALFAAFLGWIAARVGIAPVRGFSALTERITAERLHDRVQVDSLPPELAPLGKSFNEMLSRLQDSFRRLKEFSSDLAHELRTPISVLMTQSQVALSRSRAAADYREVLYSAMEEYDRLARMITDMLFLAKADNGLLVPLREPVDLRAELEALQEFYDALLDSKAIRMEVHGAASIDGDQLMIRRALSNLMSNAIRHAERASAITATLVEEENRVRLTFANRGMPIPEEHLSRLFDRFYRVDPARERSSDGAGLGLAITRSIIVAHGGTIAAASDPSGARFELCLPVARRNAPAREHET